MLTATWRTSGGRWRRDYENLLVGVIGRSCRWRSVSRISPIPIIAAILMLLSPRAKTTSVGFLLGWLAGIVNAIVLFTLLSSVLPQRTPPAPRRSMG